MPKVNTVQVRTSQAYLVDENGNRIAGFNGDSAYEVAVKNGFEGTEEEWLASLKGEQGDAFSIVASFSSVEAMNDGYNNDNVAIGKFVIINSNDEDNGKVYQKGENQYTYITCMIGKGESAYEVAVKNGFEGTEEEWLASLKGEQGDVGIQGKSAYDIAVEQGYMYGPEVWLASLVGPKGPKGDVGDQGKSAYAAAVDNGYKGTKAQWLASLKGEQGKQGEQGPKGENGTITDVVYTNPNPTVVRVGAIPPGTTFDHEPILDIITRLLYGNPDAPIPEFGEISLNNNTIIIPILNTNKYYSTILNPELIASTATIVSAEIVDSKVVITLENFVSGSDTLSLLEGAVVNVGDDTKYTSNPMKSIQIAICDVLVESFDYYWGEIGVIGAADPSGIEQEVWETLKSNNGSDGNMLEFKDAKSLVDEYTGTPSGKLLQWWIMLIPSSYSSMVDGYVWEQQDDLTLKFSECPEDTLTGNVVLDGINYYYNAIRPNAQLPIRFIKH